MEKLNPLMNLSRSLFRDLTLICCLFSSHKLEEEFEWLKKSEVLYYTVEKKGNVSSQFKLHNPWSMKCHQQQLQRMKENAKHRNQYSILS